MKTIFIGHFHNKHTEVYTWSQIEDLGHYCWLQGPLAHLPNERQLEYVAIIM